MLRKSIHLFLSVALSFVCLAQCNSLFAADVKLAWDPNSETDLAGYRAYYGTSSRSYGTSIDVGNVTTCTIYGLGPGTYYFAVTAYNTSGLESEFSTEVSTTITPPDTNPPTVAITSPTSGSTYGTSTSPLSLGGSASDNIGVLQVTWSNNRGGTGTASGTTTWSVSGIMLQSGSNVITVTALDAAGNSATATLTVTYTPPDITPPIISALSVLGVTDSSATISWTTDEASDSQVEYGTSTSYGNLTTLNSSMLTLHSQTLNGLTQNTLYHYRAMSRDTAGNIAISGDFTFTTASTCTYSIDSSGRSFTAPAANGTIQVTAPNGCNWTAARNDSWITITSGTSGTGNGILYYSVAPNTTPAARMGTITVAGQPFTVTQAKTGCDINGDTSINVLDIQLLVNVILGISVCPGNCDINADGGANAIDLQTLLNVILGVRTCP